MYDLPDIDLSVDLVATDIVEGAPVSIRVPRILKHRH
jgi:hypothetical protein